MPLSSTQMAILDTIASGEAHSYDELYGGHRFKSFAWHPDIEIKTPDGQTSAAGRYQFEKATWEAEAKRLGLVDFSPASQDAAAWDLASRKYKAATGQDLTDAYQTGTVDWTALAKQWPSLMSRAGQEPSPTVAGQLAPVGMRASYLTAPSAGQFAEGLNDPRTLLANVLPRHSLVPVDHDPFAAGPRFEPVEHDPFNPEATP